MLKTQNLDIGYTHKGKNNTIVSNINVTVNKGNLIALIGVNGSGKSTLIKTLLKFNKYLKGEIYLNNKELNEFSNRELAENISYVSSKLTEQNNITVKELISLGRMPYTSWFGTLSKEDDIIVNNIIDSLFIGHLTNKQLNNLSDGEKQKVFVARALAQNTDLIILDEPSSHLDLPNKYDLIKVLKDLTRKQNKAIIFSTHDLNIAFSNADIIWFIQNNELIFDIPSEIIKHKNFIQIFNNSSLSEQEQKQIIDSLL